MTSGGANFSIRKAGREDIPAIKRLADQHKTELGFIIRGALQKSIEQQELLVAEDEAGQICAFVQYRHRKDDQTTLYNIVVAQSERTTGIGRALIDALSAEARALHKHFILLKCPQELSANEFYRHYGFVLQEIDTGKHRALNIWMLKL